MPVDYSKWDNLELSDDSDVEVHPNVDKRSFIRAKQNQIHLERQQRRREIDQLRYERQINDGLATRIASLLDALRRGKEDQENAGKNPAEVAFRAVMESSLKRGGQDDDRPPPPPEGVAADVQDPDGTPPTYTKMMAALLDQVNKALAAKEGPSPLKPDERYDAMVVEIEGHQKKVADLQNKLVARLEELQHEEARKITSDDIHTGFDSSYVNKGEEEKKEKKEGKKETKTTTTEIELLNPGKGSSSTTEDSSTDDPSPAAKSFAAIPIGRHAEALACLRQHPQLLASETDEEAILVLAFDAALQDQSDVARRCVHQALLLQYCRELAKEAGNQDVSRYAAAAALFFRRIQEPTHQAHAMFYKDVQDTYGRIWARAKEIRAKEILGNGETEVEQIQLHAVEPGTVIQIRVPPADSADPEVQAQRRVFESFAPDMRAALETGKLEEVNRVLGNMKVDEAEELVGLFSDAAVLNIEEQIIDTTNEEGRQQLKELGRDWDPSQEQLVPTEQDKGKVDADADAKPAKPDAKPTQPKEEFPDPE